MNEIIYTNYAQYKAQLDAELTKTAEGFVRIGYLLKVARDTDILQESGYASVAEFARAEYGLDKTQVSRFIHINDKFSEGGYADHLLPEFQGYGYAKLTLMMSLPDEINENLSPSYTKAEIQTIKDEVDEEKKVSDIERWLEGEADAPLLARVTKEIAKEWPRLYEKITKQCQEEILPSEEIIAELIAPQGEVTYSVRIQGKGRVMLMISEDSQKLVVARTGEVAEVSWHEIRQQWIELAKAAPYEEKTEVAPVQQKETRVMVPEKEPEQIPIHEVEESILMPQPIEPEPEGPKEELEEDLPGQQTIENDYAEIAQSRITPEADAKSEIEKVEAEIVETPEMRPTQMSAAVGQTAEETAKPAAAEPTPIQNILLNRAQSMTDHIKASEWPEALKDIAQLKECIERMAGINE